MSNHPINGELPATGFIRQAKLIPAILPFSSATLWRMVKAKEFPAPVKLSTRVTAWSVESVREWMLSRTALTGGTKMTVERESSRHLRADIEARLAARKGV